MTAQERDYINITTAAAIANVSRVTIWRWIRDGRLPASRLGHRTTRINRSDLARLLEASPVSPDATGLEEETATIARLPDDVFSIAARAPTTSIGDLSARAQSVVRRLALEENLEPEQVVQALRTAAGQAETLIRSVDQIVGSFPDRERGIPTSGLLSSSMKVTVASPRLRQVLIGLLDNAHRYGPGDDPIDVVVSIAAPDVVELSVPARGIELPPGQRIQNLERFYRDHGESRKTGLGLGQFISRQIVDLHGGEIRAEFPPDGDARFVVRLPAARATCSGEGAQGAE